MIASDTAASQVPTQNSSLSTDTALTALAGQSPILQEALSNRMHLVLAMLRRSRGNLNLCGLELVTTNSRLLFFGY